MFTVTPKIVHCDEYISVISLGKVTPCSRRDYSNQSCPWRVRLRSREANGVEAQLWVSEQRFNRDKERERTETFSVCWQVILH